LADEQRVNFPNKYFTAKESMMNIDPFELQPDAAAEDAGLRSSSDVSGGSFSSPNGSAIFGSEISRGLDHLLGRLSITEMGDISSIDATVLLNSGEALSDLQTGVQSLSETEAESLSVFDIGPLQGLLSVMEGVNDGLEQEGFDPESVQRLVEQFQAFQSGTKIFEV